MHLFPYKKSNNIILWHGIHFDEHAIHLMEDFNIQTFVLNSGNYDNDQTNDDGTNAKLKSYYNDTKVYWTLKYGRTIVLPHHIN